MKELIAPHGGRLIDRRVSGAERERLLERSKTLKTVKLSQREVSDLEMLAIGAFSPLEGFQGSADYKSVLADKRLASGLPWTIPITLSVSKGLADGLHVGSQVSLQSPKGQVLAILELEEKYVRAKEEEARCVYGTIDQDHPGVGALFQAGEVLLAGKVFMVNRPVHANFHQYRLDPIQCRKLFMERGWQRVVGFQTRNPVHRAHEYIQKVAMETVDGLFLHPLVGETKGDDIPAEIRMLCYEALLKGYYPPDRVLLAVNPASMRYAGPMEAIFHALIRKNYGCSHFIVGRDHAGVGSYYGTYAAQRIFDDFDPVEIGITPMFFDHTFYCRTCKSMASKKTCPHDTNHHVILSGSRVREMLRDGEIPPVEFTRPEVAQVLLQMRGTGDRSTAQ